MIGRIAERIVIGEVFLQIFNFKEGSLWMNKNLESKIFVNATKSAYNIHIKNMNLEKSILLYVFILFDT